MQAELEMCGFFMILPPHIKLSNFFLASGALFSGPEIDLSCPALPRAPKEQNEINLAFSIFFLPLLVRLQES